MRGRNPALTVHTLNELLLVSSLVLLVAVAAVRISSRSGLPSLLLYLGIGIALGQDGIFDVKFDNAELTQVIGYAALVVILAEGGLGTKWGEVRPALPAAAVLSTVGVGISVGVTAAGAHYLVGLEWKQALIIGAVVSSTDAAAVFSVLRRVPLPSRITGVLEAESGFNDAPVVILVIAFSTTGPVEHWYVLIGEIALELAIGAAIGLAAGWLGAYALRHVALPASGLYPIAVMAIAVTAYAEGALAHGSGFLAVYLAAMVLGNSKLPHWPATRGFADGLGWLAQIGMFVLLGLLVTPHDLLDDFWPAVVVGLVLTVVARPLSVFLSLAPFGLPKREKTLMSWAGLRGAVPIILATIPMVAGIDGSTRVFNIVFVLVIVYTLIQGPTLPWLARALKIAEDPSDAADLGIESAPLERLRGHLLSVAIPAKSRMHGVEVGELRLPAGSAVTLVVRDGTSFVPAPATVLRRGDELLVVATDPVRDATEARLRAVGEGGKLAGWLGAGQRAGGAADGDAVARLARATHLDRLAHTMQRLSGAADGPEPAPKARHGSAAAARAAGAGRAADGPGRTAKDGRQEESPRMEKAGRPETTGGRTAQGGRASSKDAPAHDRKHPERAEHPERPEHSERRGGGDRPGAGDRSEGPNARR